MPDKTLDSPRLVIWKGERRVELYDGEELKRQYKMVLGFSPEGDKETEGDGRTPEGEFYVFAKNPKSKFHLSLGLSYPGRDNAERGLKKGLISQEEHDEITAAIAERRMPSKRPNWAARSTSTAAAPPPTGPKAVWPSITKK